MTKNNPLLYIMKQEPDGPFKIGVSQNPKTRLSTVQVSNPNKITLVATIYPERFCARTIEKKAHQLLESYHIRGEWYNTTFEIIHAAVTKAKSSVDKRFAIPVSKKQATPAWADVEAMTVKEVEARRLSAISGFTFQVDYIVPLSHHAVCGLHTENNMRLVSKARKGHYYEADWITGETPHANPREVIEGIKSFSTRYDAHIARDPELTRWVMEATKGQSLLPFKQRIHVALTGDNPTCKYGKRKKFRNSKFGWCDLGWCRCKKESKSRLSSTE